VKWGWLLSALALAAFLVIRRRKLHGWLIIAGWVAVAAGAAIGVGLIHLPKLEDLFLDIGRALGPWTYLVVGILAFLETGAFVGLIAPGETTVIVGGVVAGQGEISLPVLIAITWACAVAGDLTSYIAGRKLGRAWLLHHGERVKITEERLATVEDFFRRRGGATILIGRFIGFVRALAPFIAGTSQMPLRTFIPYDVLGAGAWAATFATLGFVFWHSFDRLTTYVSRGLFAFGTVVVVVLGLAWLVRLRRDPELRRRVRAWLDSHADKPGWRPFVRLAGPAWRVIGRPTASATDIATRFGLGRLTPGELGLELTTLLALLAVGGFTFFFLGDIASDPGLPQVDEMTADLAERLTVDAVVEVAKVLTYLGSLPVVAALALATAVWALVRHRWIDAAALAVGFGLDVLLVHVAKAAYDRDRPMGGLVDADLSAYPSGHTAYAVTLVACATVLVRAGTGWATRFAAVTVAIVAVAVVGLTRIYLRVHYLTDVLGGAGLGTAIWSLVGAIALIAGYVRHNGRRTQ
jgi:membrane protein DedA with SNARE-associated domain/membrane-associated phospholipid phosphatase